MPELDDLNCILPQYPMPVIPCQLFVICKPEPHNAVSHNPVSHRPTLVGLNESADVVSLTSKSTFMPIAIAGWPSVNKDGLALVKYFLTPRLSK
jgi:hypothetical protein